jgi:hypothetical protein
LQRYRAWVRTGDGRTFVSPYLAGDWVAGRVELGRAIEAEELPDWVASRVSAADVRDFNTEADFVPTQKTTVVFLLAYALALGFDIWLVFVLPTGSWQDHLGTVLAVVAILGFGITFLNTTELAKQLPPFLLPDLTSPRILRFIGANLRLLAVSVDFVQAFIWARDPWGKVGAARALALFPTRFVIAVLGMLLALGSFLVYFFYLVVVLPFAYLAYALVSWPLLSIANTDESRWRRVNPYRLRPSAIVASHMFELRTFFAGVLGTVLGAALKATSIY